MMIHENCILLIMRTMMICEDDISLPFLQCSCRVVDHWWRDYLLEVRQHLPRAHANGDEHNVNYERRKHSKSCDEIRFVLKNTIRDNRFIWIENTGREGWWHGLSSLISFGVIFQTRGGYISFSVAFQPNPAKRWSTTALTYGLFLFGLF